MSSCTSCAHFGPHLDGPVEDFPIPCNGCGHGEKHRKKKKFEAGCCPKCGSEFGYFIKVIEARTLHFAWDGQPVGGSEPREIRGGKRIFCQNCRKDVGPYPE